MRVPELRSKWAVPILLLGFAIFFYWKILFTGRYMFPWDAADFFYPYLSFVHEELRHFRFPFWNPFVMSGYPVIGDMEAQIFYPVNWLFLAVSPLSPLSYRLVEIQIIAHFFLAGLFMYFLARDFVGGRVPALLCGVLFMSSGAMVAHTQHLASINSIAWFPAVFLLARRGLLGGRRIHAVYAGMLYGVQILAGHWQHSVYLGLFLFLYFAYEACLGPLRPVLWPRWIEMLGIIAGLGAGLAMVQVIPSYQLGTLSVRADLTYWDVTNGNHPNFLWTLFLPNYFGGLNGAPGPFADLSFNYAFLTVPGCVLAALGLAETLRRRNWFWLSFILLTAALCLGREGYLAEVLYQVPILNLFRNAATFFDLTNFSLCLMAAIGAQTLFSGSLSRSLEKYAPIGLAILLGCATAGGLILRLESRIYGWYHMLAVLTLAALLMTAVLRKRLSPLAGQWAMLGLVLFQLIHYSMNQKFNWSIENPDTYVSTDYVGGDQEMLRFLRNDSAGDFRVAAVAEHPLSANGWNVWRMPSIYGWNPITLRRYETYIRGFTQNSEYTLPHGGPDHNWSSSMFDLLGAKYLILVNPDIASQTLEPGRFDLVYSEDDWWRIYRNKEYLPRVWFYPKAYLLPDEDAVFALMASRWFDERKTLLFEKADVTDPVAAGMEELQVIDLDLNGAASPSRNLTTDENCAENVRMIEGWGQTDDRLEFSTEGSHEWGRYRLLLQHTSAHRPTPLLRVVVENGAETQELGPIRVLGTKYWDCAKSRTADLGEIELRPGVSRITVSSMEPSYTNIYAVRLIRLPQDAGPEVEGFSVSQFASSTARISFEVHAPRDGFLLLNEVYFPGWEATVDGKPAHVLRASGIFRSLALTEGDHHVEFRFWPRYFSLGAAVSLATVAGCLIAVMILRHRGAAGTPPGESHV